MLPYLYMAFFVVFSGVKRGTPRELQAQKNPLRRVFFNYTNNTIVNLYEGAPLLYWIFPIGAPSWVFIQMRPL